MATMRITELARGGAGILIDTPVVFEWDDRTHSMLQDVLDLELQVNTVRETPPGSEEVVEQVMSTEWTPFEMHGEWLDKWAGQGFAWNTFLEFARMVTRAPLVRFEHGRHSLVGILKNLKVRNRTEREIAWQVQLSPHRNETIGNARRPPATAPIAVPFAQRVTDHEDAFASINDLLDIALANVETSADALDEMDDATTALEDLRDALDANVNAVDSMALPPDVDLSPGEFADLTRRKVMAVATSFRTVQDAALESFQSVNELTADAVIAYEDVVSMLRFEEWVRSQAAQSLQIVGVAAAGELDAKARADRRPRAVHRVRSGDVLERLAIRYTGSADNWLAIYEANHLDSIILEPGTDLVIPEPSR